MSTSTWNSITNDNTFKNIVDVVERKIRLSHNPFAPLLCPNINNIDVLYVRETSMLSFAFV